MPIYEFSCLECGDEFERIQSFSDKSLPVCPHCHSHRVQRRLSPPAIHFKGSGWYITDSKNASKTGANGKSSGDNKGEGATGESAKSEGGKSEGGKSETGKAESAKPESTAAAPAASNTAGKTD
jgi:putative FmdB family regulatory protein